jgi:H+/Cl- antiporter ClcA
MNPNTYPFTPENLLIFLCLGAIFGLFGQMARVAVGMRKVAAHRNDPNPEPFAVKRLVYSLLISLAVGATAGALAVINGITADTNGTEYFEFSRQSLLLWVGAGYAGTDFIEGLFKK